MSRKRNIWRGLTTLTASLLTVSVAAGPVVDSYRTDIDKFLGTKSSAMVTDSTDEDLYTYKSDYSSTTELLDSIEDLGERMSEEGTVLLKNENNALPLTKDETQKLSLLGFTSYYPVQGGDMGSSLTENEGTDADTVDFVEALAAKGFGINEDLQKLYKSLESECKTEVNMWGNIIEYYHITAPATDGVFASKEPSQEKMDSVDSQWKESMDDYNVMLVTIGRSSTENGTYLPGVDGVDASQNLNQTDPLGLSDDERDLINAAVEAKENNGGKVIVMLNNANAMEIDEIKNNDGVDAIMEVGLPGGYGFYGVADILSGEANPSGHLTDTYAVTNASSPAAQNFGDYEWTNADPAVNINAEEVEAEGIYTGYKYYETRYADTVLGQGNADATVGSSTGKAWNYDDEVSYPFGYGLSYTTFEYDNLQVKPDGATFTLRNTGKYDGAEIAQLYVGLPGAKVFRPVKELKGFSKVFLKAGEEKTVTIKFDDKTFRYWNMKTNKWEVEGGVYSIMIGASCADIRLQDSLAIIGTTEVMPYYTNRVSSYVEGKIQQIGNEEYETILGHSIPDGSWSGELGMNDALCQMYYAKSGIARFICKKLGEKLKKSEAAGIPDLNTLFQYNMPFRAIAKMTGGMVSMEMVEGLLKVVNGHFSGLGKVISGFFRNQKLNKQYEKDLEEQK